MKDKEEITYLFYLPGDLVKGIFGGVYVHGSLLT